MAIAGHQAPISAAFDEIEGLILPCLTLTLDSLLGRLPGTSADPRALAASLRGMAGELEGLTRLIEHNPAAGLVGALAPPAGDRLSIGNAPRQHG